MNLTLMIIGALCTAFFIQLITKTDIRNEAIAHSRWKLFGQMLECDFCLSWWCNVAFFAAAAIATNDLRVLVLAVAATPITRHMLY